ncbi:MAG: hypothetical protein GY792_36315, partial [Gammaproteobacteria bacterium]|nr:hypothetical protein [Gammaproteobacteria bacterium]
MLEVTNFLESAYVTLQPRDLLQMPVTGVKAVTEEIDQFLQNELQIDSIFDLAVSLTFKEAINLAELEDVALTDLPGITDNNLATLTDLLSINTVIDAARWPPFVIAQYIFNAAFDLTPSDDPDAPAELLPIAKKHATERVFYSVISLDEIDDGDSSSDNLTELEAPVDLLSIVSQALGFEKPAKGTIFTFCQAWYPEGVSLGQLLHSLALAPGESTKIAVIDWTRREAARLMETTVQNERLANSLVQGRAITEIGAAVAQESQSGFSRLNSYSESYSSGRSRGPEFFGIFGGSGTSSGSAEGRSTTTVISGSGGKRKIETEMSQNIQSHSHQYATATRSRFASAVQEVEQSEREELRTRIITNYNHSHALSMHYYEVVQIYRVAVEVSKREACLFVPMVILDFEQNPKLIETYRSVLAEGALSDDIKQQIMNFEKDTERGLVARFASVLNNKQRLLNEIEDEQNRNAVQQWLEADVDNYVRTEIADYEKVGVRGSHIESGWRLPAGAELVGVSMYPQELPGGLTTCPSTLMISKYNSRQSIEYPIGATGVNDVVPAIPVTQLRSINIQLSPPTNDKSYLVVPRLHFRYGSDDFILSFFGMYKGSDRTQYLGYFYGSTDGNQLGRLLNEDRLYYSQRVYESLSPSSIALLLSNYIYNDQRVVEMIDPTPLMSYGNYLVFKYFEESEEGNTESNQALVQEHQTFIPLPTGGVFAEAVLGRFNASEKLDITRFWDWQESPIPHQAPDIAPLQSGSRATDPDLETGQLESPIVNIMNPQPLPDPTGTSALLNALTVSNLFRDMSGLQQAALLAQTGLTETGESLRTSSQIASKNLRAWVDAVANVAGAYLG